MIYDCFPFFNELDLLEIRLQTLDKVVDYFVLAEGNLTHTGLAKPLWFTECADSRFTPFRHKIRTITVTDWPKTANPWVREQYQRDQIARGLYDCQADDLILICDLDEIPRPEAIGKFKPEHGASPLCMQTFAYAYNNQSGLTRRWLHPKICTYQYLQSGLNHVTRKSSYYPLDLPGVTTATKVRCFTPKKHIIRNAGWHFTTVRPKQALLEKIQACCPEFYKGMELSLEQINDLITAGRDLEHHFKVFHTVPVDEKHLPQFICANQERFAPLLLEHKPLPALLKKLRLKLTRKWLKYRIRSGEKANLPPMDKYEPRAGQA